MQAFISQQINIFYYHQLGSGVWLREGHSLECYYTYVPTFYIVHHFSGWFLRIKV